MALGISISAVLTTSHSTSVSSRKQKILISVEMQGRLLKILFDAKVFRSCFSCLAVTSYNRGQTIGVEEEVYCVRR